MSVLEAVRRANQPGVPENSVRLRLACLGAVLVAIAACASLQEIAWTTAVGAMVLVSAGTAFSHATRARPPGWVKVHGGRSAPLPPASGSSTTVSSPAAGITSVVNPLTVLLVTVLVVHSFHVPSRRDLLFTLGASAGLMAVGGALAIDLRFGLYVVAWGCCSLWGLTEMWTSASGGGRISAAGLVLALGATSAAAAAVFLVLPAPVVSSRVSFIDRAGAGGSVGVPGGLAGDSGVAAQLSRAGSPASRIRVGGYLGFAASLNTALRGNLGNTLVMQVRAQRPSYWVGETFDTWQGQSWTESQPVPRRALRESSPFILPIPLGDVPFGQSDLQTFYVSSATANLVFHAESANEVWFPSGKLYVAGDGTIVSPLGLGAGSVYTVDSQVSTATPAQLRADDSPVLALSGHAAAGGAVAAPVPPRAGAGPVDHRARHQHVRQGAVAHSLDRRPHPLLGEHPATAPRRRHGRRVPLRQPGRLLRADLDRHWPSCCARWASRPGRRWATCPGASTRSPTSTRSTPTTPMPGSRCGSPGTAGRTSTRRRSSRSPRPAPAPPRCATSARLWAASLRCRSPPPSWPPVWSSSSCAGGGRGRRRGRSGWRAVPSAPAAGPAGPADPPRPWPNTPAGSTSSVRAEDGTWSRLASSVEASAYGGLDPPLGTQRALVLEAKRARVLRRHGGGSADAPERPLERV